MIQITDTKRQNKEALKWILNIHDLRRSYFDSVATFSTLGAAVNDGMPRGTDTGNPCMNKAISLVDMENRKNWIMAIEMMEQTLSEKGRKYLDLRRDAEHQPHKGNELGGRPGWVEYVQPRYAEWFYYRFGGESVPTERTMSTWMYKIIDTTVRIAIDKGCYR